ncbi:MAG: hypothetical protein R2715_00855 [Ilumatobacteraceae bacterium]
MRPTRRILPARLAASARRGPVVALPVLAVLVVSFGSATSAAATPGPDDAPGTGTTVAPTPTTTIPAPSTTEIVISAGTNAPAVPGSNASSNGPASTAPTPTTPDAQAPPIGAVPPAPGDDGMGSAADVPAMVAAPTPVGTSLVATAAGSPTVSGNGRWVAYVAASATMTDDAGAPLDSVWLLDRSTGEAIEITSPVDGLRPGRSAAPVLSGDGCTLVVVTELAYDVFRDDDRGTRWDTYRTVLPECRDASDAPGRVEPAQLGAAVGRGRGASRRHDHLAGRRRLGPDGSSRRERFGLDRRLHPARAAPRRPAGRLDRRGRAWISRFLR